MLSPVEIAAIAAGFTEIAKSFGLPHKWSPIVAIGIAILFSLLEVYRIGYGGDYIDAALSGMVIGLTTTGLYKAGKEMTKSGAKK